MFYLRVVKTITNLFGIFSRNTRSFRRVFARISFFFDFTYCANDKVMDARSKKPRDFVAVSKNLTEEVHKARLMQMRWLQKYEWLLDEHVKLQREIKKVCEEKHASVTADPVVRESKRTCLPAPITTSGEYGWLAAKPEFRLEKYGSYTPEYPDPLGDIIHLPGDLPILAAGKGFIW